MQKLASNSHAILGLDVILLCPKLNQFRPPEAIRANRKEAIMKKSEQEELFRLTHKFAAEWDAMHPELRITRANYRALSESEVSRRCALSTAYINAQLRRMDFTTSDNAPCADMEG